MSGGGRYSRIPAAFIARPTLTRWLGLLAVLALLLFSGLFGGTSTSTTTTIAAGCRRLPRVVSHRGVDEDERGGPAPSTLAQLGALLDDGFSSFDLDLFWASDGGGSGLFVGHPPSLKKMWSLADEVHATPLEALRARARPDGLLPLTDLLALLSRRRASVGLVSLELKFPTHPEWRRRLKILYEQVAAAGVATLIGGGLGSRAEALAHREAQAAAGARAPLLLVLRDIDAPVGADGAPHANASAIVQAASLFDGGISASVKLLEPSLRGAASPLAIWTVDDEPSLRRCFRVGPDDVVSNRPRWARRTLARWRQAECG